MNSFENFFGTKFNFFFLDFEQAKEYFSERYSKYKKKNDAAVEKRCVQKSNR